MKIRKYFFGFLVWFLYRSLQSTWRVRIHEPESLKHRLKNKEPVIFAHWHGDETPLMGLIPRYRVATLLSQSKDGEMLSVVLDLMGVKYARGSSTRGGIGGLKGLVRLVKQGYNTSFAVDGPKGPIYKVKPGVFEVAHLTKAPIVGGSTACDRAWLFPRSWNQAFLPKPFAQVWVHWNEPWFLSNDFANPKDERLAQALHDQLMAARQQVAKNIASAIKR